MFSQLADYVSGAWWSYPVVFAVAYGDVLLPVLPSETAVITGGVLASSGDMHLWLLIPVAAVGAIAGDNTVYLLGRYLERPLRRRFFSGERAQERIRWAERQITERGGELIVVGRFIPGGRTAVTFVSGTLHMPWRRFITFDVVAGVVWASYAALLGYFGGRAFERDPWKGLLLAFAIALAVAGAVELARWVMRRRRAASQ